MLYLDEVTTLTVPRGNQDITVELSSSGQITTALDEDGNSVELTERERKEVRARFLVGEDETGR